MILITGATGSNGAELIKLLASRQVPVRAMVRSTNRAKALAELAGVELVAGDFDAPATVERALQGRRITFVDVPSEAMRAALLGMGVPVWQTDGLIEDYAHYTRDEASAIKSGVKDATGNPARTFSAFAKDYARAFS